MSGGRRMKLHLDYDSVCNIGHIEEIMANILSKLPVDSVLKCKLVTKFWYDLIREPKFAQLQFTSAPKIPKLIFYLGDDAPTAHLKLYLMDTNGRISPYVTLPHQDQNCSLQLISSFNGLICCTKLVGTSGDDLSIQIYNPATKDRLEVPKGTSSSITQSVGIISAPDENKYKVLRFFCDASDFEARICKCEIYIPKSGGGDWRIISNDVQCPVANPACPFFPTNVCVGGRTYWLVWSKDDREVPDYILSIDMNDNFTRIDLPKVSQDLEGFNIFTFLIEYQGHLALVSLDDNEIYIDVWSLINHNNPSWLFEGSAELEIDGFVDAINSIVAMENELLFIIKPGFATYFRFHFLNLVHMTWRISNRRDFRTGKCEPVALPFTESLFRCDGAN